METSPWIAVNGYCATRVIAGSDPSNIANRVAFIEKTPRVRFRSFTERDDFGNWLEGDKGPGGGDPAKDGTYGFCAESRQWCDNQLILLGYKLG